MKIWGSKKNYVGHVFIARLPDFHWGPQIWGSTTRKYYRDPPKMLIGDP